MDHASYEQLREEGVNLKTQLDAAAPEDQQALRDQLGDNVVVARDTAVREHYQTCANAGHAECGWITAEHPNAADIQNDALWATESRTALLTTIIAGIKGGSIAPKVQDLPTPIPPRP